MSYTLKVPGMGLGGEGTAKFEKDAGKRQCLQSGSYVPGLLPRGKCWNGHRCAQLSKRDQKHPESLQLPPCNLL